MPLVWCSSSDPLERPREVALIGKTCCRSHHGKALSFHQQHLLRFADPGVQLIAETCICRPLFTPLADSISYYASRFVQAILCSFSVF
jgi:hypothetical protein